MSSAKVKLEQNAEHYARLGHVGGDERLSTHGPLLADDLEADVVTKVAASDAAVRDPRSSMTDQWRLSGICGIESV